MYAKYSEIVNIGGFKPKTTGEYKLKQHHHVRLDSEFKQDCKVWLEFLQGELADTVNRPMVDQLSKPTDARSICFYSDSSANKSLGFGCILNTEWIHGILSDFPLNYN